MRLLCALALLLSPATLVSQAAWRVDPAPVTTVHASRPDGEVQFAGAAWATRLASGEVVIADGLDHVLRVADGSGRVVRSLGRQGPGPGEFAMLSWVGRCGTDTLHAWDPRSARVSLFDPTVGFVRQFAVTRAAGGLTVACGARGPFAFQSEIRPRPGGGMETRRSGPNGTQYSIGTMQLTVVVTDDSGRVLHQHPDVLFAEIFAGRLTPGGGMGATLRPMGHVAGFAFAGGDLVIAESDSLRATVHGSDGSRRGTFRLPAVPGRPTAAQYERAIEPTLAIVPPPFREGLAEFLRAVEPPDRFAGFSRVLGSEEGLVWFVTSPEGDPATRLRAHRPTGEAVATLEIPAALTVFEVGRDYVLGRTEDADGEQEVRVYRFTRR